MRALIGLMLLVAPTAVSARPGIFGPPAHYYGPLKVWHGAGYSEKAEKDGSWRIVAASRRIDGQDFARSMALYRAAELADAAGHQYVQVLGGRIIRGVGLGNYGTETAIVHIRAADVATFPAACKTALPRPGNCFTTSTAQVRATAGAALGLTAPVGPGLFSAPQATYIAAPSPPIVHPPLPIPAGVARATPAEITRRVPSEHLVRGRDPVQGWSISD